MWFYLWSFGRLIRCCIFFQAVVYCTVCGSHLCEHCSDTSHSTRTLAKHRRIPLSEKPREKPRCPYHTAHVMEFTCLEAECRTSPLMCYICKGKNICLFCLTLCQCNNAVLNITAIPVFPKFWGWLHLDWRLQRDCKDKSIYLAEHGLWNVLRGSTY